MYICYAVCRNSSGSKKMHSAKLKFYIHEEISVSFIFLRSRSSEWFGCTMHATRNTKNGLLYETTTECVKTIFLNNRIIIFHSMLRAFSLPWLSLLRTNSLINSEHRPSILLKCIISHPQSSSSLWFWHLSLKWSAYTNLCALFLIVCNMLLTFNDSELSL